MSSLYEISEELKSIFNDIETNGGEYDDEQYKVLTIKKEELKYKLDAYVKAIKSWEVDEKALKDEKKRFNDRQNVFKNRIERLKKAALDAVINFGEQGKTNKFVELTNCRLFSKSTKLIEVDESRTNVLISILEKYIRELVNADILYSGKDVDLQGILDVINANARAEYGEDYPLYTVSDLVGLHITISQTASVYDLFKSGLAFNMYGKEPIYTKMENATTKDNWKEAIETSNIGETPAPTIAKIVTNQSLQIK